MKVRCHLPEVLGAHTLLEVLHLPQQVGRVACRQQLLRRHARAGAGRRAAARGGRTSVGEYSKLSHSSYRRRGV